MQQGPLIGLSVRFTPKNLLDEHITPAVSGFFRSIALDVRGSLEDVLRLLTLWFKYGHWAQVTARMLFSGGNSMHTGR